MKTLFGMIAAVLMVVMMLSVSLPGMAVAKKNNKEDTPNFPIPCTPGATEFIHKGETYCKPGDTTQEYWNIIYAECNNAGNKWTSKSASRSSACPAGQSCQGSSCIANPSPSSAKGLSWINPLKQKK